MRHEGISQAISSKDVDFIQEEAKEQDLAGADYFDVNVGSFVGEETEKLQWVIEAVQEITEKPLCIDSPDPAAIRAMVPLVKKSPMINSISLKPECLEKIIPIVVEKRAKVIALCQFENSMAETSDEKF